MQLTRPEEKEMSSGEVFADTFKISKRFEMEHRRLKSMVLKYEENFRSIDSIIVDLWEDYPSYKVRGVTVRPLPLSELQTYFLALIVPNSSSGLELKQIFAQEFWGIREFLDVDDNTAFGDYLKGEYKKRFPKVPLVAKRLICRRNKLVRRALRSPVRFEQEKMSTLAAVQVFSGSHPST